VTVVRRQGVSALLDGVALKIYNLRFLVVFSTILLQTSSYQYRDNLFTNISALLRHLKFYLASHKFSYYTIKVRIAISYNYLNILLCIRLM
jgi:hypothetical protein